ncbi:hypothetical protein J6590_079178 [Homalodisca vitripennis]|nr:hypothetical protein J6590_079178 [Homalodisca vitripennis]
MNKIACKTQSSNQWLPQGAFTFTSSLFSSFNIESRFKLSISLGIPSNMFQLRHRDDRLRVRSLSWENGEVQG